MSIQSYVEHLRTKPDHIKKQIAFWSAFGITLIIFMIWIGSFTATGKNAQSAVANAVVRTEKTHTTHTQR